MGNSIIKNPCFTGDNYAAAVASEPVPNDSLGHSFTYVRSGNAFDRPSMAASISSETSFFTLSGATISANSATTASFSTLNEMTWPPASACSFESSRSFAAVPLEAPSRLSFSGPILSMSGRFSDASGIMLTASDRLSGTLTRSSSASSSVRHHQPSISDLIAERRAARSRRRNERSILQFFVRTASRLRLGALRSGGRPAGLTKVESFSDGDYRSPPNDNVQWAQGMAGEDRFHVAVSEEHGWLFVGIYDGFNGPDAADYLFANLYRAVRDELKGVLWDEIQAGEPATGNAEHLCFVDAGNDSPEVDRKPKRGRTGWPEAGNATACGAPIHRQVLKALARALRKTEEAFFEAAEQRAAESPELGLMGSCVLVMLMKGRDVYVMNVGDSRAVLARRPEPDLKNILGKAEHDLQQFKAEIMRELEAHDRDGLQSVQLTPEHSTAAEEEVMRIRGQHLNDRNAIVNGRVKGKLQVTRAFGAGYLKEPKWNSRLLEAFKVNYIGTEPYISCIPSLCHHRICSNDKFLVLSSDGLYQYFTNKEVVDQVEMHTAKFPEGDPAKHLLDELVLRAARKAGMDCRELLDIPHGDRRRYHDDVSIIVVSLEGKIWRSSV